MAGMAFASPVLYCFFPASPSHLAREEKDSCRTRNLGELSPCLRWSPWFPC
jgi:hypothetical protein